MFAPRSQISDWRSQPHSGYGTSGAVPNSWLATAHDPVDKAASIGRSRAASFSAGLAVRSATGLPGPSRPGSLTRQERSLIGVARWPDPKYNNEDSPSQQWYGRSFWKATRKIGRGIADGSITSLAETWQVATSWRSARANPSESNLFSLARKDRPLDVYSTPLAGEYSYIKDRYSQRSDGELEPSELPGIADSKGFTLTDEIDGQPVTLTSIVPVSVNLMALPTRFDSTCFSRCESARTV
jgi:hypothetical protein